MELNTPVGRLVQGSLAMQDMKNMETNQVIIDEKTGKAKQGIFFSLAFPKLIDGQPNAEFARLWGDMTRCAQEAWPALFPGGQGPTDPRFSWKYQDGDGTDKKGKSVADKPGFAGHHVVKFSTDYPIRTFYEGKFAPHEEIPNPMQSVVKRGYWVRVIGTMVSNRASGTQVPGIALYPNMVSFIGGRKEDEISAGPDAQQAFGAAPVGWRPAGISAVPGAPVGGLPTLPAVPGVPGVPGAVVAPPVGGVPAVPRPGVPGVPAAPVIPVPPAVPVPPAPPAGPTYGVAPHLAAQGVTMQGLLDQGWQPEQAVQAGHMVRLS